MQVTETLSEGLKRAIKVVVPAAELEAQLIERLADAKDKVKLNGFRPGKVPAGHLRQLYGKSIMAEYVNELVRDKPAEILAERGEKSATQPEINMTEDEAHADKILDAKADLEFTIEYEVIPKFDIVDSSSIKVERQVYEVAEEEINEQIERVGESTRSYEVKEGKAADGDRVTMNYLGKVDGEAFEGGTDKDSQLVLGSKSFIPGFEDQLIGTKAGDKKVVKVSFPEDYQAAHLSGKDAEFDVEVTEVSSSAALVVDDELAKKLGLESADKLREVVKEQIEGQYGQLTRQKVKRQILDQLDELYQFECPENLVNSEFDNIWAQVAQDLEKSGKTFEDEDTTEEAAREEYLVLARRRVRLGLVLARLGEEAKIEVTDNELQQALYAQVQQYPGQEKEIFEYFQKTPGASASLRAPIFEEKVIDHLLESATITDKAVSKEELMAEEEPETKKTKEKAKPKKKPAAKKAAKKETE